MFHLNDDVKKPYKLSRKWFNLVAKFLNNICGDGIVDISKTDEPSAMTPVRFSIRIKELAAALGITRRLTKPFELRTQKDDDGNVEVHAYLPTLTVEYDSANYTIQAGSSLGTVTEVGDGWYKINGITAGNVYLNFNSSTSRATFGTVTSGSKSYIVGAVSGETVTQYDKALSGKLALGEGGGSTPPLPATLIYGNLTSGHFAVADAVHQVKSGSVAPANGEGVVVAADSTSGTVNTLPVFTREAGPTAAAKIASSGIEVSEIPYGGGTKKVLDGSKVRLAPPAGSQIQDFDNVAVGPDGCLKIDKTEYAYFNTDESQGGEAIEDGGIVVADGTAGRVKTKKYLDPNEISVFGTGGEDEPVTLGDVFDAATEKISNAFLDFMLQNTLEEFFVNLDHIWAQNGGNRMILTDEEGYVEAGIEIPQEPQEDKVLKVGAGDTVPQFGNLLMEKLVDASTSGAAHDVSTSAKLGQKQPSPLGTFATRQKLEGSVAETDAEKIARIGVSPRAAREDHVHPLPTLQQASQTVEIPYNQSMTVSSDPLWTLATGKDITLYLPCVAVVNHGGDYGRDRHFFAKCRFNRHGQLAEVLFDANKFVDVADFNAL